MSRQRGPLRPRPDDSVTYADPSIADQLIEDARQIGIDAGIIKPLTPERVAMRAKLGIPSSEAMRPIFAASLRREMAPFVWEGDYA